MAARFAFVFLAALLIFHVMLLDATVIRRDVADSTKSSGQTLDDAISSFKTSLDDLLKNFQNNDLVQNVSAQWKTFSESVQNHTHDLAEKIQSATKTN